GGQGRRALPLPRDRGHARRVAERARGPGRDPLPGRQGNPMSHFTYRAGELHCEDVPLAALAASLGTPLYVYSQAAILDRFRAFDAAFGAVPHLVCFAVKANDHLAILRLLAREGAGFDVVSQGELWKALRAGADGRKIVFSGVGKSDAELEAALDANLLMINVESPQELDAVELARVREVAGRLVADGFRLRYLDFGGGLGITYKDETPPTPAAYAAAIQAGLRGLDCTLVLEPGRAVVGNAGVLLTRVLYRKDTPAKRFVVVDGAMNDLVRPALYGSYQAIEPVRPRGASTIVADVVGPVCESGDFLAKDRELEDHATGDFLAVMSGGAFGDVVAST